MHNGVDCTLGSDDGESSAKLSWYRDPVSVVLCFWRMMSTKKGVSRLRYQFEGIKRVFRWPASLISGSEVSVKPSWLMESRASEILRFEGSTFHDLIGHDHTSLPKR